jgi:hypothetical protein
MAEVNLYDTQLEWLLNDPAGPVGEVIGELSDKAADIARAACPVVKPENYSRWGKLFSEEHQYGPPGATKKSIEASFPRFNGLGELYGGVNVNLGPTYYLQNGGGRHGHARRVPFMSEALDTVEL